jgi:hypothetical protein
MCELRDGLLHNHLELLNHSLTFDLIKPLPCDRWVASSALQKSIRRGDSLTAKRALRNLHRDDPSSTWRRLLIIACVDIGIGALGAVVITAGRCAKAQALRKTGKDEAAALATVQMLAEAAKDRSADLLFAIAVHDPALETMRSRCRFVSVTRRLEFVADPTLSLPERAIAVWHSSGVESRGDQRVGPGDLDALIRTYTELGVPKRLLQAVAIAIKKAREPFALLLPMLWLAAAESESEVLDSSLTPSGLINGVPLYALDKHTRLGRQAIKRFAQSNAEISQFLIERGCASSDDGALRMAVFYADGALTRPTLHWRYSAELTTTGAAADFRSVNVAAEVGAELVRLVAAHVADLNAIRSQLLSRAPPPGR